MAQTGFTPLLIYSSSTATNAPTAGNLLNNATGSELAINIADGKLFYKDSGNAVQVIAWKTTPTTAGGTGLTSYTAGDLPYYASGTALNKLSIGTNGQILKSTGSVPAWESVSNLAVTSISFGSTGLTPSTATQGAVTVAGTLVVGNGGTGLTTLTANYIPYGNGTSAFSSSSTLTYNGTILSATQVQSATIGSATSSALSLQANATTYATIASSGEFLVGCTSLPVSNRTLGWGAKTHASGGFQCYQVGSNSDWGINSTSGSICNFYSDTGSALTYAGSISVNGNITTYGSISDYRLKENIEPIKNALTIVSKLNPVTYNFKNGGQKSQGFIAHELQAIIPDAVTGEKDAVKEDGTPDYQGVDTSFLIATLVAAIKELDSKFDAYVASHP